MLILGLGMLTMLASSVVVHRTWNAWTKTLALGMRVKLIIVWSAQVLFLVAGLATNIRDPEVSGFILLFSAALWLLTYLSGFAWAKVLPFIRP